MRDDRHVHFIGQFLRRRFAAQFLRELLLRAPELVHDFNHVDRNADGARLVGNGARDGLANPPDGVGGKFVAAAILEFLDAFHQADVAFLNQIEERLAAVGVFFGDGNDEAQIGLGHVRFGLEAAVGGGFQIALNALKNSSRGIRTNCSSVWILALFGLNRRAPLGGRALRFQFLDVPQAGLEFFVDVAGHDDHFLDDFLLVVKLGEHVLQLRAHLFQFALQLFLAALLLGFLPAEIFLVHLLVEARGLS